MIEHSIKVVNWKRFPFYTQELSKLMKAYFLSGLYKHEVGKSKPQWTSGVMLGVMKQLVATPQGVASYYHLCKEFGTTSIDSLIEHNILHLRPLAHCGFDIDVKESYIAGLITAESPCGFNAMKAFVNTVDETCEGERKGETSEGDKKGETREGERKGETREGDRKGETRKGKQRLLFRTNCYIYIPEV